MKTAARQVDAWQSAINQACEISQQAFRANNGLRANQKTKLLHVCADERCLMQDSFYLPVVDMNPVSNTFLLSLKSKQSLPWTWWNWCPQVQMPQSAVKSCSHTHCIFNDWSSAHSTTIEFGPKCASPKTSTPCASTRVCWWEDISRNEGQTNTAPFASASSPPSILACTCRRQQLPPAMAHTYRQARDTT